MEFTIVCGPRGEGGYSGIQVSGMIEGLFRFESFDSGICMGRKISQAFFWVASFKYRLFGGVQNNLVRFVVVPVYLGRVVVRTKYNQTCFAVV